ncbi:hypothetical protein O181_023280 [Austropuccinia psidii MF-1]|uniref:Uncharacterized protein n=1 Tax=Austropuccinia psidii MF-1 TaxID=1389203 RepID=A0A9Q3GYX9_9BASI|nr:hypothetical protein [Austropuccinia psidii MF-1]
MSPVHQRDLSIPRNQPEERKGLLRSRRSGFGQHGEWQDTEGNHSHTPIQQRAQTRGLARHGSSTSAPPTSQRPILVEHGAQRVQLGFKLSRTRGKLPEYISQRYVFQRPYEN